VGTMLGHGFHPLKAQHRIPPPKAAFSGLCE
jgi:hypothetical protein